MIPLRESRKSAIPAWFWSAERTSRPGRQLRFLPAPRYRRILPASGRRRCPAPQRHRTISRAIPAGQSFHSRQRDRRCLVPLSNCQHHNFSVLDHRSRPRNRICLFPARCAVCRRSRSSAHQHFAPNAGCDCRRRLRQQIWRLVRYRKLGPRRPAASTTPSAFPSH